MILFFFLLLECKRWICGENLYILIILSTCLNEKSKVWPFPLPSSMLHTSFLCTALLLGWWVATSPVQALPIACLMLRLWISSGDLSLDKKRCMNRHECLSVGLQMQHNPMGNGFYSLAVLAKLPGFSVSHYSFYRMRGAYLLCLEQTYSFWTQSWIFWCFPGSFFPCCL